MKKLFPYFLALFLIVSCSEEKTENDLFKENLFGKVKSVETTKYEGFDSLGVIIGDKSIGFSTLNEYNITGNYIKSSEYTFSRPEVSRKILYKYNDTDNLIQIFYLGIHDSITENINFEYDKNNNPLQIICNSTDKQYSFKIIFDYDDRNNLISKIFYKDSNFTDGRKTINSYNNKNKITKSYDYNLKGSLTHKRIYDKKENLTEETKYDSLSNLIFKWTYKYDDKDNEIEENRFGADKNSHYKIISKYNKKGEKTEESRYKTDGTLDYKYIFKYDDKGNLTEKTKFNKNNNPVEIKIYKYKYDKIGNWIEKTEMQNVYSIYPVNIVERKIEYYE